MKLVLDDGRDAEQVLLLVVELLVVGDQAPDLDQLHLLLLLPRRPCSSGGSGHQLGAEDDELPGVLVLGVDVAGVEEELGAVHADLQGLGHHLDSLFGCSGCGRPATLCGLVKV